MSQAALARLMVECGDDRQMATILRSLSRMASGDARVSGEMRALLGTLDASRSYLVTPPAKPGHDAAA